VSGPATDGVREALRSFAERVVRDLYDQKQGGHSMWHSGKWLFAGHGVMLTPAETDACFALAGVVPVEIVPLGECRDCRFARNGRERGWEGPCVSCARPKMSKFEPLAATGGRDE
jgi:hypothetical protein